jgi:hypothetical protein
MSKRGSSMVQALIRLGFRLWICNGLALTAFFLNTGMLHSIYVAR